MENIQGFAAKSIIKRGSTFMKRAIVSKFGELMRKLHSIKYPEVGMIDDDGWVLALRRNYQDYVVMRVLNKAAILDWANIKLSEQSLTKQSLTSLFVLR